MKKIVLTAIIIAFLVLSASGCDNQITDSISKANSNAVAANGFVLTDYRDWVNGSTIYYFYCTDTDVMYVEYCINGYNSSFVPIYKPDGTLLTYSEWVKERTDDE